MQSIFESGWSSFCWMFSILLALCISIALISKIILCHSVTKLNNDMIYRVILSPHAISCRWNSFTNPYWRQRCDWNFQSGTAKQSCSCRSSQSLFIMLGHKFTLSKARECLWERWKPPYTMYTFRIKFIALSRIVWFWPQMATVDPASSHKWMYKRSCTGQEKHCLQHDLKIFIFSNDWSISVCVRWKCRYWGMGS